MAERARFQGRIAGFGTTSGVRVVVGWWDHSPYGAFADVMLAGADGTRRLLAPDDDVAAFVSGTYRFDEVQVIPVEVTAAGPRVSVLAGDLAVCYTLGARTTLGRVLRLVPGRLATSPGWSRVTDPVARAALRGVRTRGSAGGGRRESYGATDHHRIVAAGGTWRGRSLGALAPVRPDPGFGFGSTPRRPSVTTLVTTVAGSSLIGVTDPRRHPAQPCSMVAAGALQESDPTPGMTRQVAMHRDGMWTGTVVTEPRAVSGWHHHGDHETTIYVLSGRLRLESGPGGSAVVEGGPGDFLRVPAGAVHRESNPSDEPARAVIVRCGTGDPTYNVDGPAD